jgi:hypothetical protein
MELRDDRTRQLEDLRRTMDELCAPELTLARASTLRLRLHGLLETLNAGEGEVRTPAAGHRASSGEWSRERAHNGPPPALSPSCDSLPWDIGPCELGTMSRTLQPF